MRLDGDRREKKGRKDIKGMKAKEGRKGDRKGEWKDKARKRKTK